MYAPQAHCCECVGDLEVPPRPDFGAIGLIGGLPDSFYAHEDLPDGHDEEVHADVSGTEEVTASDDVELPSVPAAADAERDHSGTEECSEAPATRRAPCAPKFLRNPVSVTLSCETVAAGGDHVVRLQLQISGLRRCPLCLRLSSRLKLPGTCFSLGSSSCRTSAAMQLLRGGEHATELKDLATQLRNAKFPFSLPSKLTKTEPHLSISSASRVHTAQSHEDSGPCRALACAWASSDVAQSAAADAVRQRISSAVHGDPNSVDPSLLALASLAAANSHTAWLNSDPGKEKLAAIAAEKAVALKMREAAETFAFDATAGPQKEGDKVYRCAFCLYEDPRGRHQVL